MKSQNLPSQNKNRNEDKIRTLIEERERLKEKIKVIENAFREGDWENEDAYPGHGGTVFQSLDSSYQVLLSQLSLIETELKNLEHK